MHGRLSRRAALLLAFTLLLLPCFAGAEQPSLDRFVIGFGRMAAQLEDGRALSTLMTVSPGYLPIPNRGAADALRRMFAHTQFGYLQRGLGEECGQSLRIWAAGEPLLELNHRADGARRVWSSPQLMPEAISTPMELNLFAGLFDWKALGEALFAVPPSFSAQNAGRLASLRRLLEATGGAEIALEAPLANRALNVWRDDPALGMLLTPLIQGWSVAEPARIAYTLDAFEVGTKLADANGRLWSLDVKGSRGPGRRQYDHRLDVTLTRDRNNTLRLTASATVTEQAHGHLRQALRLTCTGRLNGHSVELRVNGAANNRFSLEDTALVEQLDARYTLDWRAREPALARLGFDEWKVVLGLKGTLLTTEAPVSPASFEGDASLTLTRSRRDFLSAGVWLRAGVGDYPMPGGSEAAAAWERLGGEEQAQLSDLRARMRRHVAGMLFEGLDDSARDALLLN